MTSSTLRVLDLYTMVFVSHCDITLLKSRQLACFCKECMDEGISSVNPKGKLPHILRSEKCQKKLEARGELAQRYAGASKALGGTSGVDKPTEECKAVVFQALSMWFMDRSYTQINRNYLALEEVVGKEAIQSQMRKLFEDAIIGDKWDEERRKFGYSTKMEDKLNDSLYNIMSIFEKCRKRQGVQLN
jgi:hypothetical protein